MYKTQQTVVFLSVKQQVRLASLVGILRDKKEIKQTRLVRKFDTVWIRIRLRFGPKKTSFSLICLTKDKRKIS